MAPSSHTSHVVPAALKRPTGQPLHPLRFARGRVPLAQSEHATDPVLLYALALTFAHAKHPTPSRLYRPAPHRTHWPCRLSGCPPATQRRHSVPFGET